jgi:hypothetical protein
MEKQFGKALTAAAWDDNVTSQENYWTMVQQ